MAYTPREIKDRVAVGDDIFLVEDLGNNRIRLVPTPTHVSEAGTPVNKALLQPIEDELGALSLQVDSLTTGKVDKVPGKGLSTNDFTNALKNKLDGIEAGAHAIPTGVIVMWSGSIGSIPAGWHLCDGTNGTPDLRNRFIVGAGSEYSVGATGGAKEVTLTVEQMPNHKHTYTRNSSNGGGVFGGGDVLVAGLTYSADTTSTGGGQAHENQPPYYALAYIMKL